MLITYPQKKMKKIRFEISGADDKSWAFLKYYQRGEDGRRGEIESIKKAKSFTTLRFMNCSTRLG